VPGGAEPVVKPRGPTDLDRLAVQGGAGVVVQLRAPADEMTADAGTEQPHRAVLIMATGVETFKMHAAIDLQAGGLQGGAGLVVEPRVAAEEAAANPGAS